MKEVANRPSNNPVREAEDITEFRSSAPGLPLYKLGGGLMKECVNLEVKNGRLRSRDKLKLHTDGIHGRKFFTIPYNGIERKFQIAYMGENEGNLILWLSNSGDWTQIYSDSNDSWNIDSFRVFRMNNLFNSNLWVLSVDMNTSLVLINEATPALRPLGIRAEMTWDWEKRASSYWRGAGFDLVEMRDGLVVRSSGVYTFNSLLTQLMSFRNFNSNFTFDMKITHLRVWFGDKIYNKSVLYPQNEDKTSANPMKLYPVMEFDILEILNANDEYTSSRNGFYFSLVLHSSELFVISYYDDNAYLEPSQFGSEVSTIETMNLIPMPNARCSFNGILFGTQNKDDGVIAYSSNPGTIFQEQTTALKVLQAGVGSIIDIVPVSTGVLAFGTKGIARVASLGGGDFTVSKIAALDLGGMRVLALPGIGACCAGNGKVIFVNESTFEASKFFMGLPIDDMLGDLAKYIRAMNVADNKLYIIAGNQLFRLDLDNAFMAEVKIKRGAEDIYPIDLFSNDNSVMLITCASNADNSPIVLSSGSGAVFETDMAYEAVFAESSMYGFVQHTSTQVLARLGKCGLHPAPLQYQKLKNADEYQDYFIPADEEEKAKAIAVRISFRSNPGTSENDGLEILAVKLTRLRHNEVSSPSFNLEGE